MDVLLPLPVHRVEVVFITPKCKGHKALRDLSLQDVRGIFQDFEVICYEDVLPTPLRLHRVLFDSSSVRPANLLLCIFCVYRVLFQDVTLSLWCEGNLYVRSLDLVQF